MATKIPAKQLQTQGTLAELKDMLLDRETGWCTDDNILYYNNGGTLRPVTKVVVIEENTSRDAIAAIISAGCVPVVKLDLQGTVYLYPVHIRGNDAYTFASPISIGSGNTKDGYYWATVAANGTWSTGFKEIEATSEEEVLKILAPDPVSDKVSDDDYQAITTHKMAVMMYGSGTSSVATLSSIGSGGAKFVSINTEMEKLIVFDVAPNAVNNKHAVTRTEIPISGGGGVPSFWKGAGAGAGVTIHDTTAHAIPISAQGDHTGDDITVAAGNFVLKRGAYFWNFNIKLQRTGTSNTIQAVEAAFSDNRALIELDRTRTADPLTYSFSGLLRIATDDTAVGLTITAGSNDTFAASILRCSIFRVNGVTAGEGGGGGGAAGFDFCINGGFSIWQKGTSFDVGSENSITADMWRANSYIRDGETPLTRFLVEKDYDSPANLLSSCCVKIVPKDSVPSLTGTVEGHIRQGIDGLRFKTIFGKKLVCSFWVKSNFPGVYSIACVNYALTKSYIKEYTINRADTWEYKELVFSFENLNPSDWEFSNSGAVRFRFELYNNGDVVAPSNDTWLDGNYCGSQNQVNFISSNSNYFKLAQVKFEVNTSNVATPYVQKLDSVELLSCQKYYQLIPLSMDFNASSAGQYYSVTLPTFTNMLKEPVCSVVNDISSRQPVGGYTIAYPGANGSAAKDVQLSPLTLINTSVQSTGADNLIHSIRARFISTGSGRNAINDLLVELDATI